MKAIVRTSALLWFGIIMLKAEAPSTTPIAIVLDKQYSKTLAIRLNGESIPNKLVSERLFKMMKDKENPVVVLMPSEVRFKDWDEISGVLGKVGFLNIRYFIFSSETQMMVELDRDRSIPFSLNPSPREKGAIRDNY